MYSDKQTAKATAHRLYIVEFHGGLLKAGISAQPNGLRVRRLAAKCGPIKHHFISGVVSGFAVEWELLSRLSARGTCVRGREWFTGIPFADAVEVAQDVIRSFQGDAPTQRHGRQSRVKLALNSEELDVLARYAQHVGKPLAQAARELAMNEIVGRLHKSNFFPTH